jgi:uncharacterized protein YfaS (alpha-2-macroglobulin family)
MTEQTLARLNRWLSILILCALLMGACVPYTPEVTPQATAPTGEPTATPTSAPPTETPPPTATPLPLPPPRLLFRSPAPGEEHPLDAPVELVFDQPMDRASVQISFSMDLVKPGQDIAGASPVAIEGAFAWTDDRTVAFVPGAALERGSRYEVTVSATAENLEGTPLEQDARFEFSTVGYLAISEVMPPPDSEDLDPDTSVTVVFNRPVVPLTAITRQDELPNPLTFTPPLRGQGEWLNTSIYLFRPVQGLMPSTRYKARVAAGLTDTTGGLLAEDVTWEFTTLRPAVLETWPPNRFTYVGPTDVISVTFNQPVDHTSAQDRFSLKTGGQLVSGTFRWGGGETAISPETMIFVPGDPLPRDAQYEAQVASGAQARAGNLSTEQATTWRFTTIGNPGIVKTNPEDGEHDAPPSGGLRITFASPMQREGFMDHLSIRPQVTDVYTYWTKHDTEVFLSFNKQPATSYAFTLDGGTPDQYGAPLGRAMRIRFRTGDLSPYAALNTGGRLGTFSAYTETVVYATCLNVSRLDASLYRLSAQQFMDLNSDWRAWDKFTPSDADLMRSWSQKVEAPRNKAQLDRLDLVDGTGRPLPSGLYYLQLSAPEVQRSQRDYRPSRYMFVKSGLNLTLKQTRSEALVWATDLATGQPAAGLPVRLYTKRTKLDAEGETNPDGLFVTRELDIPDLWQAFFATTGEPGDEGFGIAFNSWDEGISPWSFDVPSEFYGQDYQGYLYTDRPIYRPGQTVYFKGILRNDDDAVYRLPQEIEILVVRIEDPRGKELYEEDLPLSDMGTLFGELGLSGEATLGTYYIGIQDQDLGLYVSTSFRVAEYEKPEYQVSVVTDRDAYLSGDDIDVTAQATYYFGGPVAKADVHWSLLSTGHWFRYECAPGHSCPSYSWVDFEWGTYENEEYYGSYGRLLAEGDAKTDNQGRVTFKVPADIAQEVRSQRFTIEISVTDLNGQQVSSRTAAIIHKGDFYAGVAPRGYLAEVGKEKEVDLLTVDWHGNSLADTPLTVVFMEHHWYSVRERDEYGYYYWNWTAEDIPVFTTTVTTGADGQALATFTPESAGSYRVRAMGRDSHGNEIRSSAYFWVWGGGYVSWRRESNSRIELIADKEEYQVGDVAEILIPSPYTGPVQALVSIERGHLMETDVRELRTNSEVLRVPITEEHIPNIFVSVVIVQGSEQAPDELASFKMGIVKLPISVAAKELKITITPDKELEEGEHYGPRQTATYDVRVTDSEGVPVEAELSLRLADLAALALADEQGPTQLDKFWRDRGLGVKTSTPLVVAMEAFNREIAPRAKGGGGGEGAGLIRTQFADTAFWDPVVHTNKDGTAQVTVRLPDNLTTWRMQARGITADTKVGRAEVDVLSSLDLLVRPVLPRFFVVGDRAEIASIVHNNTTAALEVQVNLSTEGLALEGDASRTVTVPAQDKAQVTWPVRVVGGDEAKVRMWASAGDYYDGREDTLPVYRYSTPEIMATAGRLSEVGLRQEIVQLPHLLDTTQGELTVQIDGSLTAASQDALEYLEHYPYECVEQTVSRFLPNVVTWRALDEMGIERPELRQKLAQMVGVALQRLYNEQHYDGGWGWWVTDKSSPYLTAYVLQGMLEAYQAGFAVDEDAMHKAASLIRKKLPSVAQVDTQGEANRLAYELYVLAEYNALPPAEGGDPGGSRGELGLGIRLFGKRHLLSYYGRAFLAVALSQMEPEEPRRVQTLMGDLTGDARVSATGTHWEEASPDYWNMNTDIRTTAIALWALARLAPDSELLPNTVRWLMAAREQGYWRTTQATTWSLLGLVAYMEASGELQGDLSYTVYLNGDTLAQGDVSRDNIDESHKLQVEVARLLAEEGNRLVIERHSPQEGQAGEGQLYYSAQLRYYLPADHVQALDRGIILARQYSPVDDTEEYVNNAQVGDVIKVRLTLIAPTDLYYVVVEDPLPAGFEGVDLGLKTTSVVGERPGLHNVTADEENHWLRRYGWGWWWFSHSELRDEKAVLFAEYLPRGTYEYTYLMRASVPGEFSVIPATAYEMYFPEIFGRSDGGRFAVRPAD